MIKKTEKYEYIDTENLVQENELIKEKEKQEEEKTKEIVVHIIGSIKSEGIIKINEGARISDVIEAAGGLMPEADVSKINLAYMVLDGQKIYIPNINDKEEEEYITEEIGEDIIIEDNISKSVSLININTANQAELETLSGVGPSTALKIIEHRKTNGEFEKIEDIKDVTGIGESKFNAMKDSICVK